MNLNKLSDKEKVDLCRKYYLAGFALLPILWLVNFVWFYKQAFKRNSFPEQKQIRKYLIQSIIGFSLWLVVIVAWNIVFQLNRVNWGAFGDQITFILPRGIA